MDYSTILMLVLMLAMFYFLLIVPENKRKKKAEEMRNSIRKGEKITTIGGMMGKVVQVNDNSVVFETSEDRVRIEIAKWGIQSTEAMEKAAAQQKGGLFGGRRAAQAPVEESASEEPEKAPKSESADKSDFDPEIK